MPSPERTSTAAEHKNRRASKMRKIGATASAWAALALGAGEEAGAVSMQPQASRAAVPANTYREPDMEPYVRSIEDMPGYGIKISKEIRKQLADSTVKIVMRFKGSDSGWAEYCTGVKVRIDNETFITTAKHCFSQEGWYRLSTNHTAAGQNIHTPAVNIAQAAAFEYAVVDPRIKRSTYSPDVPPVVAMVGGIMLDPNDDTDWALLKPVNDEQKVGNYQIFKDIPSLDIMKLTKKPVVGQEMAVYGMPQVTNSRPVAGKGIYLGTFDNPYHEADGQAGSGKMALVGLQVSDQIHDPCLYGGSGGSASAKGVLLNALAFRNNTYYLKNPDRHPTDGSVESNLYWRDLMEKTTGINMDRFTTICGYTIQKPSHWLKLRDGINNIAVFPAEQPAEKGGETDEPLKGGDETKDSK